MEELYVSIIDLDNKGLVYKGDKFIHYYHDTDPVQIKDILFRLGFLVEIYYIKSEKLKDAAKQLFTNYIPDHLSEWDFALKRTGEDKVIKYSDTNIL
jgi:hypothetical protein